MGRGRHRGRGRGNADLYWALGLFAGFVAYLLLLVALTVPLVTALWAVSFDNPRLYAAWLALLVGLPGLLFTLPRVRAPRTVWVSQATRRQQVSRRRRGHALTDALGVAALLLAQVPLPAPWGPGGKAATVANITEMPEVVELSRQFAWVSVVVLAVGIGAVVTVRTYRHAPAFRVIGLMLAVGAPVGAWVWVTKSVLG